MGIFNVGEKLLYYISQFYFFRANAHSPKILFVINFSLLKTNKYNPNRSVQLGKTISRLNLKFKFIFGMAAMPFLFNGTLLFQGHLPRVLPVKIYKYASCLIPYIVSFLIMCGEWSSLVFKYFKKYFCFKPNVFIQIPNV